MYIASECHRTELSKTYLMSESASYWFQFTVTQLLCCFSLILVRYSDGIF